MLAFGNHLDAIHVPFPDEISCATILFTTHFLFATSKMRRKDALVAVLQLPSEMVWVDDAVARISEIDVACRLCVS